MAHFLSEVTHERFQLRVDDKDFQVVPHNIPGLVHTHDFYSPLRCVAVLDRSAADEIERVVPMRCWTGNLNGDITVRVGYVGEPLHVIPQAIDQVFVYALQQYGTSMWVGFSNGYMMVYDMKTLKCINETKAHGGPLNCFLRNGDFIFSGGSDWQICQWNAQTMEKVHGGQFGCQNAVRCLALDGTYLYSGSDDCIIRCWDLTKNMERCDTWPVLAHHDSVRAIVVSDIFLFSSSTDGTINVWNTQTAQFIQQLGVCNASITALCIDVASSYLWAGSSDGMINIFDTQSLSHVGTVCDHANTNVAGILQVGRQNAVQSWTVGKDGKIKVWFMDESPDADDYQDLSRIQEELQKSVEEHRNRVLANYEKLEQCKSELLFLEGRDHRKKTKLAKVLGNYTRREIEKKYVNHTLIAMDRTRQREWNLATIATFYERASQLDLLQKYWVGLVDAAHKKAAFSRKEKVAVYMASYNNDCIMRNYLHKLIVIVNIERVRQMRDKMAIMLANRHKINLRRQYYSQWRKFSRPAAIHRLALSISKSLRSSVEENIMSAYWIKIETQIIRENLVKKRIMLISKMAELKMYDLMRRYFFKLLKWVFRCQTRARLEEASVIMEKHQKLSMLRYWYNEWLHMQDHFELAKARKLFLAQQEELGRLNAYIDANSAEGDEYLDSLLYEKQKELTALRYGEEDIDDEISTLEKINSELELDIVIGDRVDFGAEVTEQLSQSMYLLKAHAFNCADHQSFIAVKKDEIRKLTPQKAYIQYLLNVRPAFSRILKPKSGEYGEEHDWCIQKRPNILNPKSTQSINDEIVALCFAYDTLNKSSLSAWVDFNVSGKPNWKGQYVLNLELVANLAVLLRIAKRAYRFRHKLDPDTGMSLEMKKKGTKKEKTAKKEKDGAKTGVKKTGKKKDKAAGKKGTNKKAAKKAVPKKPGAKKTAKTAKKKAK